MNKYQAQEIEYLNGEVKRWRTLASITVVINIILALSLVGAL
jgi:nitrate reductase NapE component